MTREIVDASGGAPVELSERSSWPQLIGDAIARAYKTHYGKGPEHIKVIVTDDTVVAILRGGFSVVETSLHRAGHADAVRDQRRAFGDMIAPTLSAAVTEVIDRDVVAVLADTCQSPDLGAIVLVLGPPRA
jgi:uncharacterized protein YbcI